MENRKVKTYYDLIADTENTWDADESLEEFLFDDCSLDEALKYATINKGDIIMANNGVSKREDGMDIKSVHRVFVIEDAVGDLGNRTFKGYLLSSQVHKANYYNPKYPNNIYIADYSTILSRGRPKYNEAFINLSDLYVIEERLMDLESGGIWKGHATQEFIDFIDKATEDLNNGKSIGDTYWIKD